MSPAKFSRLSFISVAAVFSCWLAAEFFLMGPKTRAEKDFLTQAEKTKTEIEKTLAQFPDIKSTRAQFAQADKVAGELEGKRNEMENGALSETEANDLLQGSAVKSIWPKFKADLTMTEEEQSAGYRRSAYRAAIRAPFPAVLRYLDSLRSATPYFRLRSFSAAQKNQGLEETPHTEILFDLTVKKGEPVRVRKEAGRAASSLGEVPDPFLFVQKFDPPVALESKETFIEEFVFRGQNRYTSIGRSLSKN